MKYRRLGTSDINVSEVSLGCWTLGGLNWIEGHATGWANVDPHEIESAIKVGIDGGINHFDNADVYGNGDAERLLASCLQNIGLNSNSLIIASKVGHYKGTAAHAYEKSHIRRQCEQSLINLRRDYLDIYYLHHAKFGPNDRYLDDAAETMQALQAEGKIRLIGQSAYKSSHFKSPCQLSSQPFFKAGPMLWIRDSSNEAVSSVNFWRKMNFRSWHSVRSIKDCF